MQDKGHRKNWPKGSNHILCMTLRESGLTEASNIDTAKSTNKEVKCYIEKTKKDYSKKKEISILLINGSQ